MATAQAAAARLIDALQQLHADLADAASGGPRIRRYLGKREAAVQALGRHADFIAARFAFVDGERVEEADPRLLEAFYADPLECVAARYCWALLGTGNERTSLPAIIAATLAEHSAFTAMQAAETPAPHGPLAAAEWGYRRRADRTAYILAILRRLLVVERHVAGPGSQAARALESEIVNALETAEEVAATLREIRRRRVSWRGPGKD